MIVHNAPPEDATSAIQAVIDSVHEAGGGRVEIPPGRWKCACLILRSNMELHLAHGAILQAIDDPERYPASDPDKPALITASGSQNIALTGTGRVDGLGNSKRWEPDVDPDEFRFSLVRFVDCHEVKIHDVGFYWTRSWAVHLLRCEDVHIRGCDIIARRDRINSDGIDPDNCRRVRISDCRISTGDDAIVVKSTGEGVCEDILVESCLLNSSCAALKIGTETIGTIRNVIFNNCLIRDSNMGLAVYLKDGGTIQDIHMSHCQITASHPFPVTVDHTPRFHNETPPGTLERVFISNMTIRAQGRVFIGGTGDAPVHHVELRDIDWYCTDACPVAPDLDRPDGAARIRPDPDRIPVGRTPHHIVLHNAHACRISNFRIIDATNGQNPREPCLEEDCTDCRIDGLGV